MINTLSLYDYNLSQLDKFEGVEHMIIKKLNVDINPKNANLPITLKKIIFINPRYYNNRMSSVELEDFIRNLKLPFDCDLYLSSYFEDYELYHVYEAVAFFIDKKITFLRISKNNSELQNISNKFDDIYNEIKSKI